MLALIAGPILAKAVWKVPSDAVFQSVRRTVLGGALIGAAAGSGISWHKAQQLDLDGVADRAYRVWFNARQSRIDRSSAVGATVGGTSVALWVAGQSGVGAALATLPSAAAMGFALGTLAGVGMEVATTLVQSHSGRAGELQEAAAEPTDPSSSKR